MIHIEGSKKLNNIKNYPFDDVSTVFRQLKRDGKNPIDFGEGDPTAPAPKFVRDATKKAVDFYADAGYPSYVGQLKYREAIAKWMKRRFGVTLDPVTEICSTIGSKESISNFPHAFINPGDVVIVPSPGYPVMKTGTIFAGGIPYFVSLKEKEGFLLNYKSIPKDILRKAKIIWINYPNSPTGVCADRKYYLGLIKWAQKNNIIIAADEGCYIDLYFDKKPMSILELEKKGIITFYSLSKRNNMTGYRVGWLAGDKEIVDKFKKIKTNMDSGTPDFIQAGAIAAISDEKHAKEMRTEYKKKRDIMLDAFKEAGWVCPKRDATYYMWLKTPSGMDGVEFAKKLLLPELALVVTPGAWISDPDKDNVNPGEHYVRFALVPPMKEIKEAARRIKKFHHLINQ
jgi:LL-diaminopimelate aminotransferase